MRNDETPYPPSGSQGGASPDEVLDAAHFSESEAQADLASRLSMLDRLHEEGQISAAELKEARLRVMAEAGAPRGFDSDVVADSPGRPSSAVGGTSSSVTGMVVDWPWTTIPSESPTSRASTPASSSKRAMVKS